ncbi:MAG TPA: hypothetical protein VK009_13360 [Chloroflexota bacterium]|nr:hypothetical protein [Chloroflexota bacterium]
MASTRREIGLMSLSLGLYPGAILWGFQLWVSYGLVNVICGGHGFTGELHLVSLFFGVLTAGCILLSLRLWRELHEGRAVAKGSQQRAEFMALSGVAANSIFLLFILLGAVPSFFLDPCVG